VTKVQAEVDVAITMTTMELLLTHPELKTVIFVIGDRDFYDLFKYLKKTEINTLIFGFKKNLSGQFFNLFSPDNIFYINDYWDEIIYNQMDDEFPPLTPNDLKLGEQRHINFRKCNSDVHKVKLNSEKDTSASIKKKKKKKKNKNSISHQKKEEEKRTKKPNGTKDCQISHSSTEDSIILNNGKNTMKKLNFRFS
jgi:hypothetical protein